MELIIALALSASLSNPYLIIEDTYKTDPQRAQQMELIVEFFEVIWGEKWWLNENRFNMDESKKVDKPTEKVIKEEVEVERKVNTEIIIDENGKKTVKEKPVKEEKENEKESPRKRPFQHNGGGPSGAQA